MKWLTDYDPPELGATFAEWGCKQNHAARVLKHFYDSAGQFDGESLQLGRLLSRRLRQEIELRASRVIHRHASADGTVKLLVEMARGGALEAVLMPSHRADRAAGCVSSQVGCAMGCDFCASTLDGLSRNLEAGEIVEQFLHLKHEASQTGRRLCTLVFMGIGEPLHNLDNVMAAIRRIASPGLGELSRRAITISTVGIVPGIERLAEADLNVHLALSLHAPDEATRARLVPMNRRWGVGEIMAAARRFQERTGRVVNVEYCLLAGVNDTDEQADLLADLMAGFRAHVNLIPYNAIGAGRSGACYGRPGEERIAAFLARLVERGVVAHVRRSRGDDVSAACGQLRQWTAGAASG